MTEEDLYFSTFWDHVDELRKVLIKSAAIIALAFICCLPFYKPLFGFFVHALHLPEQVPTTTLVRAPIQHEKIFNASTIPAVYLPKDSQEKVIGFSSGVEDQGISGWKIPSQGTLTIEKNVPRETLVILHPMEGIGAAFKISFWTSVVATSPLWLLLLFRFFLPALNRQERALAIPFIIASLLCFSLGIAVAYFITIPIAVHSLQYFNEGLGANLWGVANTIDFMLFVFFSNGLAFESSVILFFLIHLGILSAEVLVRFRRQAIVCIFILSALLTPPDVVTQLLLAFPLMAVYEIAILYARGRLKSIKIIN